MEGQNTDISLGPSSNKFVVNCSSAPLYASRGSIELNNPVSDNLN